jgi:glycosyltransferase involved in cell wall biosynthesis
MRVALFVPAPFAAVSGGYIYDRAIVAGLRARGHAVDVLELDGTHPLADATALASARAAWAGLAAEAVPVIDGLCLPAFAPLADELSARHTVGLIHHPTALETGHDALTRTALRDTERALLPRLARAIVTSPPTAKRLSEDFGVAAPRITVVVPGTAPAPRSAGSGGPGCAILSIGVIMPRKGHDVLVRALARLVDLDWTLTIAGAPRDPVHAHSLGTLVEQLGIAGRVTFAGEVVESALETLWQHADVFALATHYEGYGMAIAEALKRGLPVATTSGGAAGELVSADSGIVVAPGDEASLARAMRRLIFDTALRADMADAAWRIGERLPDWPAQCDAFAAALVA